jgi:pimeloyl-ACP methyl ester carboxylesterase
VRGRYWKSLLSLTNSPLHETMTLTCDDCQVQIKGRLFGLLKAKPTTCANCPRNLCNECAGNQALIPFKKGEDPPPIAKESIQSYCKECFQNTSVLDYSRTYDIIEPDNGVNEKTMALIWVHGGGSSRIMFARHAPLFANKNYRSILIDMPGHGTLVDSTTLTLDECTNTVKRILESENCDPKRTIYIGASLGAYTGFHILGHIKDKFAGAVMMDCGQNVGPDCSLKARFGLWMLRKMAGGMSNKSLMNAMIPAVKKSKADFHLVETCYAAGMFFQQGEAQCDCLHAVRPAAIIPDLEFPILFFNGSEDHRDSENVWLSHCKDKRSSLHVYPGGDHFFCHDSRFVDDMMDRIAQFIQTLSS